MMSGPDRMLVRKTTWHGKGGVGGLLGRQLSDGLLASARGVVGVVMAKCLHKAGVVAMDTRGEPRAGIGAADEGGRCDAGCLWADMSV